MNKIQVRLATAGNVNELARVLIPYDEMAEEKMLKAKWSDVFSITLKKSRSPKYHGMVMAIINELFDNQEVYSSKEVFRTVLKLQCGWVYEEPITFADGSVQWVPKPTDWTNCDQDEFEEFFSRLKEIVRAKLGDVALESRGL